MNISKIKKLGRSKSKKANAELRAAIKELSSRANRQLTYLNKYRASTGNEQRSTALGKAESYLQKRGLTKFGEQYFKTNAALASHLSQLQAFLSNPTSTVSGLKQLENKTIKSLSETIRSTGRERGDKEQARFKLSKSEYDEFLEFLRTDFVQEVKGYDSARIFADVLDAIRNGKTVEDVENAWKDYINKRGKRNEVTIDQAWENWTGVNPFLPREL